MKRFIAALIFLISLPGFAQEALDTTPEAVYLATRDACTKTEIRHIENQTLEYDRLYAGYFPGENFNKIINFIKRESALRVAVDLNFSDQGKTSQLILTNTGFKNALSECYPNSTRAQKFFYDSIVRADKSGRYVGVFMLVAVMRGAGAGVNLVKTFSATAYKYLMLTSNGLMGLTLTSFLHSDSEEKKQTAVKFSEIFAQKNRNRPKQAASEAHAGMDLIKIKVRDTIISLNTELSSATTQRQIEIQEKIKRLELVLTNN